MKAVLLTHVTLIQAAKAKGEISPELIDVRHSAFAFEPNLSRPMDSMLQLVHHPSDYLFRCD